MRFAVQRKWIPDNPASALKAPNVQARPTLLFTHSEIVSILAAIEAYAAKTAYGSKVSAQRMRSLVLLLRYSGMRIGDAVTLGPDRLNGNRLFLYTAKTGTPVYTVLPEFVVKALEDTPMTTERYFFWTGVGKLSTAVRMWDMRLKRIFDNAKISTGHAHRFRDYLRRRVVTRWRANGARLCIARPHIHQGNGAALRAVGESATGTTRSRRFACLEP